MYKLVYSFQVNSNYRNDVVFTGSGTVNHSLLVFFGGANRSPLDLDPPMQGSHGGRSRPQAPVGDSQKYPWMIEMKKAKINRHNV